MYIKSAPSYSSSSSSSSLVTIFMRQRISVAACAVPATCIYMCVIGAVSNPGDARGEGGGEEGGREEER